MSLLSLSFCASIYFLSVCQPSMSICLFIFYVCVKFISMSVYFIFVSLSMRSTISFSVCLFCPLIHQSQIQSACLLLTLSLSVLLFIYLCVDLITVLQSTGLSLKQQLESNAPRQTWVQCNKTSYRHNL
jgi:hypothetical protein